MRTPILALGGAVVSITLLAACSKPADNVPEATAANADAVASDAAAGAAGAAEGAMAPGGVVSPPPANGNEAVNTDGNIADGSQSPGSSSFTEGQARGHIEKAGYSDVTALTKTPDGLWTGKAKKDGKTTDVSVDFKGAVTAR